uniref:G_PROTEIN_RECEP_F1_2 domain-containing protein n=1 Tax=Syphacia muris TaxID=451379 RepID=A0A0N5B0G9_9BILA
MRTVTYNQSVELCIFHWSTATYYFITLALLTVVPSVITILFTYFCIFSAMRNSSKNNDIRKLRAANIAQLPAAAAAAAAAFWSYCV